MKILMKYHWTYNVFSSLYLIIIMTFLGCKERFVYKIPDYQTENPLGVEAPTGFHWEMIRSIPIIVEVNDEMNGKYYYLVEVFDDNPLANPDAGILAKGAAKKNQNFVSQLTISSDIEYVYVRQTDAKGKSRIKTELIGAEIYSSFSSNYIETEDQKRIATRSEISIPSYSVNDSEYINGKEWNNDNFKNNENYKISAGTTVVTNKGITIGGATNSKIYIAGTWNISNTVSIGQGVELIILEGGILTATEFSSKNGTANVVIMPGGTITITGNKGATIGDTNSFYNLGTFNVMNGTLDAQNGDGSIFYIGGEGVINAKDMQIHNDKTYIENHGLIKVETISKGGGAAILYNLCAIEATKSIDFSDIGELFMDGGIIVSPIIEIKATPVTLRNGAMVKCDKLMASGVCAFTGVSFGNRSLFKVRNITNSGSASVSVTGHITLENNMSTVPVTAWDGADIAPYDNADVVIEGCKIEGNEGNEGITPTEIQAPIIVSVSGKYTYVFEDNWPLFGDYDMNDVVFKVNNIKTTLNLMNMAQKFSFDLTLLATGAEKRIAIALMLDMVEADNVKSVVYSLHPTGFNTTSAGVEKGQEKAVIPLFDNIHKAFGKPNAWYINTIADGAGSQDNADPILLNVEIEFDKPVLAINLNMQYLNFFIISDIYKVPMAEDNRKEIHVAGFAPTDKINMDLLGKFDDNSLNSSYYLSNGNLAWGIVIPDDFKWMTEQKSVITGYPDFEGWVTSGGKQNELWWKTNVITENLYMP